ncbi:RxLR effector protein [Phytophthora megakarya]|uniref:RxLR effector protein n=1 Tax=Phytophthora megakarya TaxID=4795 RepID=A0A225VJD0_9STRA|nr:RxLR effector protein [Phytophthora megakarya]
MENVTAPSLQPVFGGDQNKKTNLRIRMLTTTDEGDDSFNERGINLGASSITKIKELTISATHKFAASVKLKISSRKQQATDNLFKKFNVGKVESNLLESAQFQNWVNSVNKVYKKNVQEGEVAMVTTLTAHYGDKSLLNLLAEANKVPNTKLVARKLEEAQFKKWQISGLDESGVFNLLKLEEAGETLFKSPLLHSWDRYSTKITKNPENTMLLTLKTYFDDKTLAKMLTTAKEDNSIATKLEKVELDNWLKSDKTSDDIFKLLNLDGDSGNLFQNPGFKTWVSYVTKLEKKNSYDIVLAKLLTEFAGLYPKFGAREWIATPELVLLGFESGEYSFQDLIAPLEPVSQMLMETWTYYPTGFLPVEPASSESPAYQLVNLGLSETLVY